MKELSFKESFDFNKQCILRNLAPKYVQKIEVKNTSFETKFAKKGIENELIFAHIKKQKLNKNLY